MTEPTFPVTPPPGGALVPARTPQQRLLEAFLSGRSPRTLRAYRQDLDQFAAWAGVGSAEEATALLLSAGPGPANEAALTFRNALLARGLASATVNRKLAALRSLLKLAKLLGMVGWDLSTPGVKVQALRDATGCGTEGFRKMLAQLAGRADPKAVRDRCILMTLFTLGLRRGELVGIDLADVNLDASTVAILGKGRTQKEKLTLPPATRDAVAAWIAVRPAVDVGDPAALFLALDRAHRGHRLTGTAVYQLVEGLGRKAGIRARPHGLRHAAVSEALRQTNGNVRDVARFARHRDVKTTLLYDDAINDAAGSVARGLADVA